jgi:hypothetical protein
MGYGDEGLLRANFWWKRKVYGYVIDSGNATNLDYTNVPAPSWATTGLQKTGNTPSNYTHTEAIEQEINISDSVEEKNKIFNVSLGKWSDALMISEMQNIFSELGYSLDNTWEYDDETISIVYTFQIEHEIVSSEQDTWAGSYGPQTRSKLKEVYSNYTNEIKEYEQFIQDIADIEEKSSQKAAQYIDGLWVPAYGDISYEVRELQNIFSQLWHFDYNDTAIFWDITKKAILDYQLDKEIVLHNDELWAGVFWPKTREQLTQDYTDLYFHEYLAENELDEVYREYIEQGFKA